MPISWSSSRCQPPVCTWRLAWVPEAPQGCGRRRRGRVLEDRGRKEGRTALLPHGHWLDDRDREDSEPISWKVRHLRFWPRVVPRCIIHHHTSYSRCCCVENRSDRLHVLEMIAARAFILLAVLFGAIFPISVVGGSPRWLAKVAGHRAASRSSFWGIKGGSTPAAPSVEGPSAATAPGQAPERGMQHYLTSHQVKVLLAQKNRVATRHQVHCSAGGPDF